MNASTADGSIARSPNSIIGSPNIGFSPSTAFSVEGAALPRPVSFSPITPHEGSERIPEPASPDGDRSADRGDLSAGDLDVGDLDAGDEAADSGQALLDSTYANYTKEVTLRFSGASALGMTCESFSEIGLSGPYGSPIAVVDVAEGSQAHRLGVKVKHFSLIV